MLQKYKVFLFWGSFFLNRFGVFFCVLVRWFTDFDRNLKTIIHCLALYAPGIFWISQSYAILFCFKCYVLCYFFWFPLANTGQKKPPKQTPPLFMFSHMGEIWCPNFCDFMKISRFENLLFVCFNFFISLRITSKGVENESFQEFLNYFTEIEGL